MENRTKICICYVITAFLITAFVYSLVSTHFSSIVKMERLQYEVEEITKVILGRKPDEALLPHIDSYVKKRTEGLWDELAVIKRKLELLESQFSSSRGKVDVTECSTYKNPVADVAKVDREEPSYSMDSLGASIVYVDDIPLHPTSFFANFFGVRPKSNYPGRILEPSMQLGHCYAFSGKESTFIIKLSHKVIIKSITVEHIAEHASLTGDISNAPKDFHVYGVKDLDHKNDNEIFLGSFQYNNLLDRRAQMFNLSNEKPFHYCKIKVTSNYGNERHTCIYRVAVHGKLV